MTDRPIDQWMRNYEAAWDSNERGEIERLFTGDAEYRSYPWADPSVGRDAIVEAWLAAADVRGDHSFSWSEIGVDGHRHFVEGCTRYQDGRTYENLWIIDLDEDGKATAFTEWYMESSKALGPHA